MRPPFGFELIMLRPANVFGLGHFWSGSSGGQKMHNLIEAAFDGRAARIPAAETLAHEYVYAKDMGRAVDLRRHGAAADGDDLQYRQRCT